MTLVEMALDDAEVWGSTDSSTRFGWEIAKANLVDEKTPEVGAKTEIRF